MVSTKLTSKGQVTIPVEIRRKLDLRVGDELVFAIEGDSLVVRGLRHRSLAELRGVLPAKRSFPGRDQIRAETGRRLGAELARKADSSGNPPPADTERT